MNIIIREYRADDVSEMNRIWNEVVEDGVAFPQEEYLNEKTGAEFFAAQTYSAVAQDADTGKGTWLSDSTVQCSRRIEYPCQTFI